MDAAHFCAICHLRRSEELIISFIAALLTGILSGWGIGGGSLLIVFMTAIQGLAQRDARNINLIYFLPTSLGALYSHIKNKLIEKKVFVAAAVCGTVSAFITAYLSASLSSDVIKILFGIFLIFIGIRELFKK